MLLVTTLCLLVTTTVITGDQNFKRVLQHFWDWRMRNSPEFSTYQGECRYNDLTLSMNLSVIDKKKEDAELFLSMLSVIDEKSLSMTERVEYSIFQSTLQTFVDGHAWANYSLNPVNFLEGIHIFYPAVKATSNTRGDYENYIVRLHNIPNLIDEVIARFNEAIRVNLTYHQVSIKDVPDQIEKLLVEDVEESYFYRPFNESMDSIPEKDRESLRQRGKDGISGMLKAYGKMMQYIKNTYLHHTRPHTGVNSLPNGAEYYQTCLKWHTTLDVTPEEVHSLGLREVDRIYGNMQKILERQSYQGTVKSFLDSIQSDSRFIRDSGEKILKLYEEMIDNRIKPIMNEYFQDVPEVPMIVEASLIDGTEGGYALASEVNPGKFIVNVVRPKDNPTFNFMALSLHEAYPGHHLQHSYAMTANLPKYRRFPEYGFYEVPFYMQYYSAYVEGWGLYSEYLGEEMGLYKDEYELMGRYSAEMLRACRLVLDTGLHYFNWTREQAIEYMLHYTAYAEGTVEIEVNRYITWPGQACAYKIGEIKIRELRKRATMKLGPAFDIKSFHSTILRNGAMPLNVLERVVNDWIDKESEAAELSSSTTILKNNNQLVVLSSIFVLVLPLMKGSIK